MNERQRRLRSGAAIVIAVAVIGSLAGLATAVEEESPLVGSWTLTISMGGKEFDVNVVVNADLTGTATWEWSDDASNLENVVTEGNEASFACPDILGLEFYGTIEGDTYAGEVASDYGDGEFDGVQN